jgi:hypothetical protein
MGQALSVYQPGWQEDLGDTRLSPDPPIRLCVKRYFSDVTLSWL